MNKRLHRRQFAIFLFGFMSLTFLSFSSKETLYRVTESEVTFVSDAPLELIEAKSEDLAGILSTENQNFAFTIIISSFMGFNSPLQREHFNENYLESDKYEKATFTGSIIEEIDFSSYGVSVVRAKGKLSIHGVEKVLIIEVQLDKNDNKIEIASEFSVLLEDFNITIPRIVNKKIAESIQIKINAILEDK